MEKEKTTFIKWLDNFWYHEKVKVIIAAVLLVFLVIGIVQCTKNQKADVYIMYGGDGLLSGSDLTTMNKKWENFIPEKCDFDKNGEKRVEYTQYSDPDKIDSKIKSGDVVILLLSPDGYKYCKENGYLATFDESLGYTPDKAKDEYSIELFDLECASEMGVNMLPIDTLLCVCIPINQSAEEGGETEHYRNQIRFLDYMIEFKG